MFETVLGFDFLFKSFILRFVLFSFFDEFFDIIFRESTFFVGNGNVLRFTGTFFHSSNVHDSISINIKGDFNLWSTSWSWWNTIKVEFTKLVVIFGHLSFTFEDLDQYTRLVISISCEDLLFFGWDSSVSFDEFGHNTSSGFNTKREWDNIKKENGVNFFTTNTSDNSSLDGSTVSNSFIWVNRSVWSSSIEEIFKHVDNLWNSSGSTNHDNFMNLVFRNFSISETVFNWFKSSFE